MVGLVPTFEHYIFHVLMVFTVSMAFHVYWSSRCMPLRDHPNCSSRCVCLHTHLLPLWCLYLPFPQIPVYWKWSLLHRPGRVRSSRRRRPQFEHRGCTGPYPEGDCPTIQAFRGTYFETMDTLTCVEDKYDATLQKVARVDVRRHIRHLHANLARHRV